MSGTTHAGSRLLARPAVLRTFALGLVGRLGYGVLPLSFLFTVRQATGSFSAASGAVALFGLGALAMPLQARALDRWGQRRVLPLVAGTWVAVLVAALTMSTAGVSAPAAWVAIAVPLGVCAPALGPSMRAQWRWFTEGTDLRARAYSVDTVAEEMLYLVGPAIAGGLLAVGPARNGLALVAALAVVGTLGLVV
ncbi:MAG TPA: MFS transporter, partial [Nocardioides sp.]